MKTIKDHIKSNNIKKVYVLFGSEPYLIRYCKDLLQKALLDKSSEMMNLTVLSGADVTARAFEDAVTTLPFLAERRVVIIKDSGLFVSGKKAESDKLAALLPQIPETSVAIFSEVKADKRTALYKIAAKEGYACELNTPSENELITWLKNLSASKGLNISGETAAYLLRTTGSSMDLLSGEINKLESYLSGQGIITPGLIDQLCAKSLQTKIFDLTAAVGNKNSKTALDIFSNLLLMKESPVMVISMLARQFRLIYQCKTLYHSGLDNSQISKATGQMTFAVKECLRQGSNFTEQELKSALSDCLEADTKIKTGQMNDRLAVEMLIIKYCL